jgi:hypothetical protein
MLGDLLPPMDPFPLDNNVEPAGFLAAPYSVCTFAHSKMLDGRLTIVVVADEGLHHAARVGDRDSCAIG